MVKKDGVHKNKIRWLATYDKMMFESKGQVIYSESGWVTMYPHPSIGNYYKAVLERRLHRKFNTPMHGYHVTVIAGKYEDVRSHPKWLKYHKCYVPFTYTPEEIEDDFTTYWLVIHSRELEELRLQLDLYPFPRWPFHMTIANLKNL